MKNQNNRDYVISPLKLSDADLMETWESYTSPLFLGYNYNSLTEKEKRFWYISRQRRHGGLYFSIKIGEEMIGFIGLKEINKIKKTAKLGLVFDPKWVSQGYGSQVLEDFLLLCFEKLNMNAIDLEVNSWNERALNLYRNFGFNKIRESYQLFENQNISMDFIKENKLEDDLVPTDGKIMTKVYYMRLKRSEYDES